jgi:hypothetical protein
VKSIKDQTALEFLEDMSNAIDNAVDGIIHLEVPSQNMYLEDEGFAMMKQSRYKKLIADYDAYIANLQDTIDKGK